MNIVQMGEYLQEQKREAVLDINYYYEEMEEKLKEYRNNRDQYISEAIAIKVIDYLKEKDLLNSTDENEKDKLENYINVSMRCFMQSEKKLKIAEPSLKQTPYDHKTLMDYVGEITDMARNTATSMFPETDMMSYSKEENAQRREKLIEDAKEGINPDVEHSIGMDIVNLQQYEQGGYESVISKMVEALNNYLGGNKVDEYKLKMDLLDFLESDRNAGKIIKDERNSLSYKVIKGAFDLIERIDHSQRRTSETLAGQKEQRAQSRDDGEER